jgi:hypothetical protein
MEASAPRLGFTYRPFGHILTFLLCVNSTGPPDDPDRDLKLHPALRVCTVKPPRNHCRLRAISMVDLIQYETLYELGSNSCPCCVREVCGYLDPQLRGLLLKIQPATSAFLTVRN